MLTFFDTDYKYGFGTSTKQKIIRDSAINFRVHIAHVKTKHKLIENIKLKNFCIEKTLKDAIKQNILFIQKNQTYRGSRHLLKFPVRGQRTHTNAKTQKRAKHKEPSL